MIQRLYGVLTALLFGGMLMKTSIGRADELLFDAATNAVAHVAWSLERGDMRRSDEGLELRNNGSDGFVIQGAAAGDLDWQDYTLSFRAKLVSVGEDWRDGVWVGVRCTPEEHGYVVGFYAGQLYVYKMLFGESVSGSTPMAKAASRVAGLRDGQWHQIGIAVAGTTLTVTIDGHTVLQLKDNDAGGVSSIRAGRIELAARKWSRSKRDTVAVFRDIRVEGNRRVGAQIRRPWTRKAVYPTYAEYEAALHLWAKTHPHSVDLDAVGKSLEGTPIYCVRVTDKRTPDDNKHVILVSALDAGGERSGTCSALCAIEWLLSDDVAAAQARHDHIVLFMPIVNPYGYEHGRATNSKGVSVYAGGRTRGSAWDVESLALRRPEEAPEIAAFKAVVDRWRPDALMDLHGVGLDYAGQLVQPSIGSAMSNISNRPWDRRLVEFMIHRAGKAGFGFNRMEVDAQQVFFGEQMAPIQGRCWIGRPFFYTALYAYAQYHTILFTSEVAWEQSAVALIRGLLEYGSRTLQNDPVPALPVNATRYVYGPYTVQAYGQTLAERRRSRIELWQHQESITLGFLYNYVDGRDAIVCAVGPAGLQKLLGRAPTKPVHRVRVLDLIRNVRKLDGFDARAIEQFLLAGPQRTFAVDAPRALISKVGAESDWRPQHGLAIHFPIFYPDVNHLDVRLNGRTLKANPTSGYQRWYRDEDGYTVVRVNVPPQVAASQDLFLITCAYRPPLQRAYGWRPRGKR